MSTATLPLAPAPPAPPNPDPVPSALRVPTPPPLPGGHAPTRRQSSGLREVIEMGRLVLYTAQRLAPHLSPEPGSHNLPDDQPVSFRRLAKLNVLPMGASSMWRAAAIYRLAQKHPELYAYQHLGVAHLAPLLCLDGSLRLAVLRRAERRRWSRRRLEARLKLIARSEQQGLDPLHEYRDELLPQKQSGPTHATAQPIASLQPELRPAAISLAG